MINRIVNEIKSEYQKKPVQTGFMMAVALFGFLTFIKPSTTSGFLTAIGISAINFIFLALIILGVWYFFWRK